LLKYKNNTELIVSPRGQFNEGALGIKKIKKTIFLFVSKITRVHSNIKWHATSIEEKEQISSKFPNFKSINVITNLSSNFKNTFYESKPTKNVGELELIYIARIHPIKNLLVVLEALRELSGTEGKIILDVYGPIENLNYWKLCKEVISNLTGNIQVHYRGIAERDKIYNLLSSKHFSVLVSESENFGHSIIESLQTSTPVIIGPNTPWKDLEFEKAGFILNQIEPIHLKDIIRNCQMMNNIKYLEYSNNAFIYSKRKVDNSKLINEYVKMFSI
jgi:glycosyltransferase involved in cell wall biosynthesis